MRVQIRVSLEPSIRSRKENLSRPRHCDMSPRTMTTLPALDTAVPQRSSPITTQSDSGMHQATETEYGTTAVAGRLADGNGQAELSTPRLRLSASKRHQSAPHAPLGARFTASNSSDNFLDNDKYRTSGHTATRYPRRIRRSPLEQHFRVDKDNRAILPGVPIYDPDWNRDVHDFFNLVVLVPVVALNIINWNWDTVWTVFTMNTKLTIANAWTGEYFDLFLLVTVFYFAIDLLWILAFPNCVKSPATILQHHVATLLYLIIPYRHASYQWCMGACMLVECNTWFLIARRVFNKQGFPPWIIDLSFVSIRVKLISIFFYTTWVAIRVVLYPYLLPLFYQVWLDHSAKVGTKMNLVFWCVPLHSVFCLLNLKWSYDLLMSKIRYWRRLGKDGVYRNGAVASGL